MGRQPDVPVPRARAHRALALRSAEARTRADQQARRRGWVDRDRPSARLRCFYERVQARCQEGRREDEAGAEEGGRAQEACEAHANPQACTKEARRAKEARCAKEARETIHISQACAQENDASEEDCAPQAINPAQGHHPAQARRAQPLEKEDASALDRAASVRPVLLPPARRAFESLRPEVVHLLAFLELHPRAAVRARWRRTSCARGWDRLLLGGRHERHRNRLMRARSAH